MIGNTRNLVVVYRSIFDINYLFRLDKPVGHIESK